MHPTLIVANMKVKGTTCAELARRLGLARATISLVIHGRERSRRVEQAVAEVLGLPVEKVFPERYGGEDSSPTTRDAA